jgi:hypothetical protein
MFTTGSYLKFTCNESLSISPSTFSLLVKENSLDWLFLVLVAWIIETLPIDEMNVKVNDLVSESV